MLLCVAVVHSLLLKYNIPPRDHTMLDRYSHTLFPLGFGVCFLPVRPLLL